jgi:uncharacterized protein with HEPN domain
MSERDIPLLLQDILDAIGNIKDFTRGITLDIYLGDLKTKHAVERNFSIIAGSERFQKHHCPRLFWY